MKIRINGQKLHFEKIDLIPLGHTFNEVFGNYDAKTLGQTLELDRYRRLKALFEKETKENMARPLGEYLLELKRNNNNKYLEFLNNCGDETFRRFKMTDEKMFNQKGIYYFSVNCELKYIGKTTSSFKKRINAGYGNISPRNCFKKGQSVNCRILCIAIFST